MLLLTSHESIKVGNKDFTVWSDDTESNKYYVLPSAPSIRIQDGKPVFQFLKFRSPIERPDGPKGGLCTFDVELVVTDSERQQIETKLKEQKGHEQIVFWVHILYQREGLSECGKGRFCKGFRRQSGESF